MAAYIPGSWEGFEDSVLRNFGSKVYRTLRGMIVDTNLGGGWGRGLEIKEISKEIFIH